MRFSPVTVSFFTGDHRRRDRDALNRQFVGSGASVIFGPSLTIVPEALLFSSSCGYIDVYTLPCERFLLRINGLNLFQHGCKDDLFMIRARRLIVFHQ